MIGDNVLNTADPSSLICVRVGFHFMGTLFVSKYAYKKPYLPVADQLSLLMSRGMEVTDLKAASACLERIGYYRLSGYWYPFRESALLTDGTGTPLLHPSTKKRQYGVKNNFRVGTTFSAVMDLYVFDKRLRMIFLDAIERIEVGLRVDIALLLGARGALVHRDPSQLHGNFTRVNANGQSDHLRWLDNLDQKFRRSKEEFVKHFKNKYPNQAPPVWIAIELWDFGLLSIFLGGLKHGDRVHLAGKYLIPRENLLTSWVRNINNVRNICAHHSRLWNRSPADQISPPKQGEIALLDHLASDSVAQSRVYATAAVMQFFLRTINPSSQWSTRLKQHMRNLPSAAPIGLSQLGFPVNWETLPLWN